MNAASSNRIALLFLLTASIIAASGGCSAIQKYRTNGHKVGPNYTTPSAVTAEHWIDSEDGRVSIGVSQEWAWWQNFSDPRLDSIILQAQEQNLTLRDAAFRICEARFQRNATAGNLFPQQQQLTGSYSRIQQSREAVFQLPTAFYDDWNLGFQAAWELDFWGKFRRAVDAADANLEASISNYDDVLVLLLSEVASAYIDIRTFEERLKYARKNIELQSESVRVTTEKFKADAAGSQLDQPQALANLAQTKASVPDLETSLRQSKNRLATLLSITPPEVDSILGNSIGIPVPPESVAIELPSELLRQRPDLRRAERQIAAQSEQIGISTADLFPAISLGGNLGLNSERPNNLFTSSSWAGTIGPSFAWNVLNYGRIKSNIAIQDAKFKQLLVQYRQQVLEANAEVENAIVNYLNAQDRLKLVEESTRQSAEATRVARAQYKEGLVDYNRLFTVEQLLVQQQDALASAKGRVAAGLVDLYKSLGGGWQIRNENKVRISADQQIASEKQTISRNIPNRLASLILTKREGAQITSSQ